MLADLFHRRWAVPILAALHDWKGSKFITLVNRLRASRDSVRQTLGDLMRRRLVMRNPGLGHPIRPEYILAPAGRHIAPAASRFMHHSRRHGLEQIVQLKWSMPVTLALSEGPRRFSELQAMLPSITARALTLALKDIAAADLVHRRVVDGYPPTTIYALTREGDALSPLLASLASQLRRIHRVAG